ATVLPDEGGGERLARLRIPHDGREALLGDRHPDELDARGLGGGHGRAHGVDRLAQDLGGILLDRTRARVVDRELAVLDAADLAGGGHPRRSGAGGALIDREHGSRRGGHRPLLSVHRVIAISSWSGRAPADETTRERRWHTEDPSTGGLRFLPVPVNLADPPAGTQIRWRMRVSARAERRRRGSP